MGQYKKCYIFAGSPEAKCSGVEFDSSRYVICADGGYILAKKMGIEPDVIIGYFDNHFLLYENILEIYTFRHILQIV